MNRRQFIAGAAAVTTTTVSALSASHVKGAFADEAGAPGQSSSIPDWKIPPADIDPSEIISVEDFDLVIVGAGITGVPAALTAVQEGAKTVLLERNDTYFATPMGPNWFGGINSKAQQALGLEFNRADITNDLFYYSCGFADQRLINLWYDRSGEAMDWFTSVVTADGTLGIAIETDNKDTQGKHMSPPISHVPYIEPYNELGPNTVGSGVCWQSLVDQAVELGLDIRYLTPAVRLVLEDGAVTGVIAKNPDGEYVQFNASKGVILCTGGYLANEAMKNDMCRGILNMVEGIGMFGSGDGISMAVWAGADYDRLGCTMTMDRATQTGNGWNPGSQPFLRVNCFGERFVNEDGPYDFISNAAYKCPGSHWWTIFDANYWEDMTRFHTTICSRTVPVKGAVVNSFYVPQDAEEFEAMWITPFLETGEMVTADSIDGLFAVMKEQDPQMDSDTLKATIDRYNELTDLGVDEDFGKYAIRLSHIGTPPFYAIKMYPFPLITINGLRVNTNIQVLRPDGSVIKGLYAAGTDQGGFYGMTYPWYYGGIHCGKAVTFGRLAVLNALGIEK
ncbi:MAG: FAD-binding protein [Coriobacteriales bacterium]|nr:FAD-binding protein [Coriobacteriales bacterium]